MKRQRLHRTRHQSMHECITEIWRDVHELGKSWESIAEFGAVAGIVRIGDKFNRLKNLIKNPGTQRVNDESIADTLLDMANYCIMLKIELENPFTPSTTL